MMRQNLVGAAVLCVCFFSLTGLANVPRGYGDSQAAGYISHLESASLQEEDRVFEKLSRKQAPLRIRAIKRKRGEAFLGKKFTDREDWFQGLSFVLENTSGKTVVYIRGGLLFPRQAEMKKQAPPLYHSFHYGLPPFVPEGAVSKAQQLTLKPGETITFTLSDSDYDDITANLRRLEYAHSIKAIKVNFEEIFFDDGSSWAAGTYFPSDRNEGQPIGDLPQNYSAPTPRNFGEFTGYGDIAGFFLGFQNSADRKELAPSKQNRHMAMWEIVASTKDFTADDVAPRDFLN